MILLLATRYRVYVAWLLFIAADVSFALTARAGEGGCRVLYRAPAGMSSRMPVLPSISNGPIPAWEPGRPATARKVGSSPRLAPKAISSSPAHLRVGGPNQPEMGSFKSVNMSNMVNLFTGNFSYNIPLLDVGGYPVNLYYDGEVGLEQDASWVGLGWNINPGSISRNMRGIPDDFDGTDTLVQTTNLKPDITFGVTTSADLEGIGIKVLPASLGLSTGVSWNSYLGLALDLGVKGGVNFKVADKVLSEKGSLSLGASLGGNLSSRSGLTLSPNVSLTSKLFQNDRQFTLGAALSTSYNSREGIKSLQITDQASANVHLAEDKDLNYGEVLHANTINFARPSYLPTMRVPMLYSNYSGKFQLGGAIDGIYVSGEIEAYEQRSTIDPGKYMQYKPMVGYLYYENATDNPNAVTDFTRFNDREVTPNTPIISAPQYTYDVYTIQGEGTGGSIRPYRGDLGYVRDNYTGSQNNNTGVGVDIGLPGHYGVNLQLINTPTTVTEWTAGNTLHSSIPFTPPTTNGSWENVCFRNPGEPGVLDNNAYNRIGGTDLVRFEVTGDPHNPEITTLLDRFSKVGNFTASVNPTGPGAYTRQKRGQVINFFNADDASLVGLDKKIRSYNNQTLLDPIGDTLLYTAMARDSGYRRGHHISQIDVTESNGKRYIYGLPVYNVVQQDYTFTVDESGPGTPDLSDTIQYNPAERNPAYASTDSRDGYVQITQTPAYAHSFLLTGLLSPDYVDVTGDGITDDDLGQAVKFNYTEIADQNGKPVLHQWRTPVGADIANFNPGTRSQVKDDKGLISYGERESWYLHSIETKTMIAVFKLENRCDGKGVGGVDGGVNSLDSSSRALKQIDLYSKSDLRQNGLAGAHPIKTVHFAYSYTLCPGTRDNTNGQGKLTLDSVWFTFNGQTRLNKDKYAFSYTDTVKINDTCRSFGNPAYVSYASDRWGTYKPQSMNPGGVKNSDFPYTPQDQPGQAQSPKAALDTNAAAWSLKRILLPSGGQLEIGYESDDYAYVQNLHAMDMFTVAGFGSTSGAYSNRLFDISWSGIVENNYLFVKVPWAGKTAGDVLQQYLLGDSMLAVKLDVIMPTGTERITSYAKFDSYGVHDSSTIWIHLINVNNVGPLSLTAVEYLKEQLPAEAFPGYDNSKGGGLERVADALIGMWDNLEHAFSDPVSYLRGQGKAQATVAGQCFVRLNDPDGFKYGGGQRVKFVKLKDNWQKMTGQYNSVYTQTYDYTTTETFNGTTRTISSGVAAYEPGIGGDENPFQNIVQVQDKLPLGPASYGAIEMPILEPFFPAPTVGYSQITVRSVSSIPPGKQQKSRSGIGRQVTQFYTAKDFPVYYSNTWFDPSTDLEAHDASTLNFFHNYAFDSRALSQGFLVATNDMHGKMRSQTSYADNDTTLKVNYTENFYRNTGVNGLNETFPFVSAAQGGAISSGNLGIDIELMTDTREFTVQSSSEDIQGQVDYFPPYFWIPFIWPVTGSSENDYRAITTTKVIGYHAVLDSVVVYDKGSMVSTKNLLYDAETGDVVVTRTNNEFDQPLYSTSYPAWWAYDGMGPAYRNIGYRYSDTPALNFTNGILMSPQFDVSQLVSGDELLVTSPSPKGSCPQASAPVSKLWVMDLNKNNPPFPATTPSFIFIDSAGNPYTDTNVISIRVIRSGRRNMLDEKAAMVTSMNSPIVTSNGTQMLRIDSSCKVLSATGAEFSEKWQTDQDEIRRFTPVYNAAICSYVPVQNCTGTLENINPYVKGLLGNFRNFRTMVCYGPRTEADPTATTNLSKNGFIANFSPYWNFGGSGLQPNTTSPLWIESVRTTRVNAQGLELETKNALDIYTSAQYGYNKTLPVAVTNNSPYYEMVYEGFEDNAYAQSVDNTVGTPCPLRQANFIGMPNSQLVFTDTTGFAAHTGKYVLGVNGNATASLSIPIISADNYNYTFSFGTDTSRSFTSPGVNVSFLPSNPSGVTSAATLLYSPTSANIQPNSYSSTTVTGEKWDCYIQIYTQGTYTFTASVEAFTDPETGKVNSQTVTITDLSGTQFGYLSVSHNQTGGNEYSSSSISVALCPGIYHIQGQCSDGVNALFQNTNAADDEYIWNCSNCTSQLYTGLTTQNGCISTTPITGSTTMENPVFNMPGGVPMVISAWVRESPPVITSGADTVTAYSHSAITVFTGTKDTTFYPQGPIIDGWQRIEGYFTPVASGTAKISFVDSTGNMSYFDDIRIHPFNAEMKSYIYDPVSLRLSAELDDNNYATFYEYDEEGTLVRTKAETQRGIQTIKETRSAKQKNITTIQ